MLKCIVCEKKMKLLEWGENHKERKNNTRYIVFHSQNIFKILDWLYEDATIFLDRKYQKYLKEKITLIDSWKTNGKRMTGVSNYVAQKIQFR